jgi:hypothetical protein
VPRAQPPKVSEAQSPPSHQQHSSSPAHRLMPIANLRYRFPHALRYPAPFRALHRTPQSGESRHTPSDASGQAGPDVVSMIHSKLVPTASDIGSSPVPNQSQPSLHLDAKHLWSARGNRRFRTPRDLLTPHHYHQRPFPHAIARRTELQPAQPTNPLGFRYSRSIPPDADCQSALLVITGEAQSLTHPINGAPMRPRP